VWALTAVSWVLFLSGGFILGMLWATREKDETRD
jgi:hypothetical protein